MRWFLIEYRIRQFGTAMMQSYRLVQAQTEIEAVAKIKLELKPHQQLLSYKNCTIL